MNAYERHLWRIAKIQRILDQEVAARRASEERYTLISGELAVLKTELLGDTAIDTSMFGPSTADQESDKQAVAFVNGHPVVEHAVETLRHRRFNVILSIPVLKIWARRGVKGDGEWLASDIKGLRINRLTLLLHMLTHPRTVVGTHNADEICRSDDISPQALARTIHVFRSLLCQYKPEGPYILTTRAFVSTGTQKGYMVNGYTLSPDHNYLVILKKL